MFFVSEMEMSLRLLWGLTAMQSPSRNNLKYVVPESLRSGGRVWIAN